MTKFKTRLERQVEVNNLRDTFLNSVKDIPVEEYQEILDLFDQFENSGKFCKRKVDIGKKKVVLVLSQNKNVTSSITFM